MSKDRFLSFQLQIYQDVNRLFNDIIHRSWGRSQELWSGIPLLISMRPQIRVQILFGNDPKDPAVFRQR
ncbi:MAG: hypothetical protein ACE5HC_07435 [Candidatus Binatia bacterium]